MEHGLASCPDNLEENDITLVLEQLQENGFSSFFDHPDCPFSSIQEVDQALKELEKEFMKICVDKEAKSSKVQKTKSKCSLFPAANPSPNYSKNKPKKQREVKKDRHSFGTRDRNVKQDVVAKKNEKTGASKDEGAGEKQLVTTTNTGTTKALCGIDSCGNKYSLKIEVFASVKLEPEEKTVEDKRAKICSKSSSWRTISILKGLKKNETSMSIDIVEPQQKPSDIGLGGHTAEDGEGSTPLDFKNSSSVCTPCPVYVSPDASESSKTNTLQIQKTESLKKNDNYGETQERSESKIDETCVKEPEITVSDTNISRGNVETYSSPEDQVCREESGVTKAVEHKDQECSPEQVASLPLVRGHEPNSIAKSFSLNNFVTLFKRGSRMFDTKDLATTSLPDKLEIGQLMKMISQEQQTSFENMKTVAEERKHEELDPQKSEMIDKEVETSAYLLVEDGGIGNKDNSVYQTPINVDDPIENLENHVDDEIEIYATGAETKKTESGSIPDVFDSEERQEFKDYAEEDNSEDTGFVLIGDNIVSLASDSKVETTLDPDMEEIEVPYELIIRQDVSAFYQQTDERRDPDSGHEDSDVESPTRENTADVVFTSSSKESKTSSKETVIMRDLSMEDVDELIMLNEAATVLNDDAESEERVQSKPFELIDKCVGMSKETVNSADNTLDREEWNAPEPGNEISLEYIYENTDKPFVLNYKQFDLVDKEVGMSDESLSNMTCKTVDKEVRTTSIDSIIFKKKTEMIDKEIGPEENQATAFNERHTMIDKEIGTVVESKSMSTDMEEALKLFSNKEVCTTTSKYFGISSNVTDEFASDKENTMGIDSGTDSRKSDFRFAMWSKTKIPIGHKFKKSDGKSAELERFRGFRERKDKKKSNESSSRNKDMRKRKQDDESNSCSTSSTDPFTRSEKERNFKGKQLCEYETKFVKGVFARHSSAVKNKIAVKRRAFSNLDQKVIASKLAKSKKSNASSKYAMKWSWDRSKSHSNAKSGSPPLSQDPSVSSTDYRLPENTVINVEEYPPL